MDNDKVAKLLKDYRSYEYAARNCGEIEWAPLMINERRYNPNGWDRSRYNRIVNTVKGAVDFVLSDDQRTVIVRKYMERNTLTLNQISDILHKDRTTIGRWHTEALNRLALALAPLNEDEYEINNFDHFFNPNWKFVEPKESA